MNDCTDCRTTFAALKACNPSSERAQKLDAAQPECRCQGHSVSPFSHGPVGDDEILIRVLVAPQHMDKKKKLPRAAALSDAERAGLSVFRELEATDQEIRGVAEKLVERARATQGSKAGVFGVLRMVCRDVRLCRSEEDVSPAYCVYDTAEKEIESHAEVFQRVHQADDSLKDARRLALFNVVKTAFVSVGDFRKGLLKDLAPAE